MSNADKNQTPIPTSNLEPGTCHGPTGQNEMQKINPPVIISVHCRRHRLADPDGICAKWAIDAIVKSGVIEDDSAAFVKEVRFSQEKISKAFEEDTIITLMEV